MLILRFFIFILLTSCASEPSLVKPLVKQKKPVKKQRILNSKPKELITHFYQDYFSTPEEADAPLSKGLSELIEKTNQICKQRAKGEICGWAAFGDPYLDGQEYSDKLNLKNSQFKAEELRGAKVRVRFNIYPELASKDHYQREITFKLIKEQGQWVIDDIFYTKNRTARKSLQETQKDYAEKSYDLKKILAFSKKEKLKTNLKTLKKDKIFSAYKQSAPQLTLSLRGYPGPDNFNQLTLSCDLCASEEISLNQTLLCQTSFKSLYQQVISRKNTQELGSLFKQARFEEGIKIDLPESGHQFRVQSGDMKCDGSGGKSLRVDFFYQ